MGHIGKRRNSMLGSCRHEPHPWLTLSVPCFLILCAMTNGAVAEGLTVDEAVRLALQNNTALQAQQYTITAAEGELRQARTFPNNPRLEWEGRAGRERHGVSQDARTHTAKLSQEFPLGGNWRSNCCASPKSATASARARSWTSILPGSRSKTCNVSASKS